MITDVSTHWNSSYNLMERYLEQKTVVYSALTERALKRKEIANQTDVEVSIVESVIVVMKPLKTITTMLRT